MEQIADEAELAVATDEWRLEARRAALASPCGDDTERTRIAGAGSVFPFSSCSPASS